MKLKLIAIAAASLTLLSGCHTFKETSSQYERLPLKVEKNPSKEGRACYSYFFPFGLLYTSGDISVETARKNGDIKEIVTIEKEVKYGLFYEKICTVVKGE